jgi:hypothetical protein
MTAASPPGVGTGISRRAGRRQASRITPTCSRFAVEGFAPGQLGISPYSRSRSTATVSRTRASDSADVAHRLADRATGDGTDVLHCAAEPASNPLAASAVMITSVLEPRSVAVSGTT